LVTPLGVTSSAPEIKNCVMAQARDLSADSFTVRIEDSVRMAAQGKTGFLVGKAIDSSLGV
jgi:hypothetical protein